MAGGAGGRGRPENGGTAPGDARRVTAEARSSGNALGEKRATGTGRPRRGRPRSERADRVILVAAAEVMAEKGIGGLSMEEVAVRAGVGKTTIYRRWSSRGTLALDAFLAEFEGQQGLPDTGTFAGDLRAALGGWVKAVSGTSAGTMLVGLIAEMQQDSRLAAAWQDRVIAPLRAQYSIMLDRGVSRGEIPAETDAGIVLDLVFGACYYRLLLYGQHGQRPLNEQFVNPVVKVIAAGVGAREDLTGWWLPPAGWPCLGARSRGDPLQSHGATQAMTGLNDGR
jgi:AcrR family transcriptional regulator